MSFKDFDDTEVCAPTDLGNVYPMKCAVIYGKQTDPAAVSQFFELRVTLFPSICWRQCETNQPRWSVRKCFQARLSDTFSLSAACCRMWNSSCSRLAHEPLLLCKTLMEVNVPVVSKGFRKRNKDKSILVFPLLNFAPPLYSREIKVFGGGLFFFFFSVPMFYDKQLTSLLSWSYGSITSNRHITTARLVRGKKLIGRKAMESCWTGDTKWKMEKKQMGNTRGF